MKLLAMLAASLMMITTTAATAADAPKRDECSAYLDLSRKLNCPSDGYLEAFGDHYCRLFVKDEAAYSAKGKAFLAGVRACLLKTLDQQKQLTCSNVRQIAIRTHIPCYVQSGFCDLPFFDRQRILGSVWTEIKSPDFFDAAMAIQGHCQKPIETTNYN